MAQAKRGSELVVPVGNLDLYRDIGSVADLVDAFEKLLKRIVSKESAPGCQVFNLCSGQAKHLRGLAHGLAQRLGVNAQFEVDPARVRPRRARLDSGLPPETHRGNGLEALVFD